MREIILTAWNGNTSLAKAFWGYFVLGQFVVAVAIIVIFSPALLFGDEVVEAVKFISWPIYYAFLVWAMVSIWQCSHNTKHHAFSVAAKIFVVMYTALWVIASFQGWSNVA